MYAFSYYSVNSNKTITAGEQIHAQGIQFLWLPVNFPVKCDLLWKERPSVALSLLSLGANPFLSEWTPEMEHFFSFIEAPFPEGA